MVSGSENVTWQFELYIAGGNQRSTLAKENLQVICKDYLHNHCHVDVFDIKEHSELTVKKQITATPFLIKKYPLPEKTIVGDLSFTSKVVESLDIEHPRKIPDNDNSHRDGLEKQGLRNKHHYKQRQR